MLFSDRKTVKSRICFFVTKWHISPKTWRNMPLLSFGKIMRAILSCIEKWTESEKKEGLFYNGSRRIL